MKVAVWNLGHWQRGQGEQQAVWTVLREEIEADVALLQEVVPPPGVSAAYAPIGGRRPWGSAVVGLTVDVHPITHARGRYNKRPSQLVGAWPGSVAVASCVLGGRTFSCISMYGLIDDGYADTTVHRQLSDLVPLFDDPTHEGSIILGGDLNITTQWIGKDERYGRWERTTLDRIRALGFTDCLDVFRDDGPLEGCRCRDGEACRHVQTQRHNRSPRPWQNDYAFASTELLDGHVVRGAFVHDSDLVESLGGHLPIVLTLDP